MSTVWSARRRTRAARKNTGDRQGDAVAGLSESALGFLFRRGNGEYLLVNQSAVNAAASEKIMFLLRPPNCRKWGVDPLHKNGVDKYERQAHAVSERHWLILD